MKNCIIALAVLVNTLSACAQKPNAMDDHTFNETRTEEEWKKSLTPEQYRVLREKGTEYAWSGKYNDFKKTGTFKCAACQQVLFSSDEKYDSGSGWPSFWDVADSGNVYLKADKSHGMERIEVMCGNCGGHLGHVFEDGPRPTGKRYCINSISLEFEEKQK